MSRNIIFVFVITVWLVRFGYYLTTLLISRLHNVGDKMTGEMRMVRENQSTRRKPAPVPLCPPQIPPDLGWA
jgi:hypothetical protein